MCSGKVVSAGLCIDLDVFINFSQNNSDISVRLFDKEPFVLNGC